MQNKTAIQVFAILLALACLWHLSFTFVTSRVESRIHEQAGDSTALENALLDSMKGQVVYNLGFVQYTYDECKKRELNLGLDLKGGMNVTLEVSIPDLLMAMSNKSQDSAFNKAIAKANIEQRTDQRPYVDIFYDEYKKLAPNGRLSSPVIFGHKKQGLINTKMSNDEVVKILEKEADQAIDRTFQVLTARIDQFGVTQPNLQKLEGTNRILVELPGLKDPTRVKDLLQATAKLEFYETYENAEIFGSLEKVDKYLAKIKAGEKDTTVKDTSSVTVIPDTTGIKPVVMNDTVKGNDTTKKPDSNAMGELTQAQREKANPLFAILSANINQAEDGKQYLGRGPVVGYAQPSDTAKINAYLKIPEVIKMLPKDLRLRWTKKSVSEESVFLSLVALKTDRDGNPALGGDVITDATDQADNTKGGFMITMKMNGEGADKWSDITNRNKPQGQTPGRSIAIVLDDKVYSFPTVEGQINGGISTISGNFSSDEAKTLASVLKAGKLPTPAVIVEQTVVGPSLGKKAINDGLMSLLIAFIVILIYMAFYYGKAGLTADLALFTNLFFLVGSLAALGTTLTLPGIAGMVLTIGMSVDANVLIFERIKEELRHGKRLKIALEDGYKNALSAIIDGNITIIIVALILMVFGAGPVKGFAVVLFIGVLTSLFSGIFISRLIFEFQLKRNWNINFWTKPTKSLLEKANINFVGMRKISYVISAIVFIAGTISFFTKGFNFGIDLKGGRSYTVVFDNTDFTTSDISAALASKFEEPPIVKYYGTKDKVKIMTKYKVDISDPATDKELEKLLYDGVAPFYKKKQSFEEFADLGISEGLVQYYKVGPTMARDVKSKSIWAVALALLMIFLYVLFRFKGWQYGVGATFALLHDVVFVLAFFSIFDGLFPFSLEINQEIIAAILTVIGYSINDTVIVFDRIREYLGEGKKGDMKQLINGALNNTLGRTVNTSLTVFFVIIISFIFGGEAIRGFAFAMLIGVIVGTYSSLFIATPIVVDLKKNKGAADPAPAKK